MASYLSIELNLSVRELRNALRFVFENTFFRPVAVGCVATSRNTLQWLLGGACLETFLARTLRGRRKNSNVTLLPTTDPDIVCYLDGIRSDILKWELPKRSLSPFEKLVPELGATLFRGAFLQREAVSEMLEWTQRLPQTTTYLFGCLDTAVSVEGLTQERAFRTIVEVGEECRLVGDPLLELSIRPFTNNAESFALSMFSASDIWSSAPEQLTANLDYNLEKLIGFVRECLAFSTVSEVRSEGSAFLYTQCAINRALAEH